MTLRKLLFRTKYENIFPVYQLEARHGLRILICKSSKYSAKSLFWLVPQSSRLKMRIFSAYNMERIFSFPGSAMVPQSLQIRI